MAASSEAGARPPGAFYQSVLTPHPSTPHQRVRSILVGLSRRPGGMLDFTYALDGDTSAVRLPQPARGRADGLWRHTCFEAFVAPARGSAYIELNFSPSGQWAAYAFDRYREGMTAVEGVAAPQIVVTAAAAQDPWVLTAGARIDTLADGMAARIGLAAVIEDVDGRLSYWALYHGPGRPDFHDPDGFRLRI
jgi:hypothetical protein